MKIFQVGGGRSSLQAANSGSGGQSVARETIPTLPHDERVAGTRAPVTPSPAGSPPASTAPVASTAAPRALLAALVPGGLGTLLADAMLPLLARDGRHASGVLRVDGQSYAVTGAASQSRLKIAGPAGEVDLALADDGAVSVRSGQGEATFPLQAWASEKGMPLSRFEVAAGRTLFTQADGKPLATFTASDLQGPVSTAVRASNPYPAARFAIEQEHIEKAGHRITNESSRAFPAFSIRGGVYLGVGSAQNYDHLTAARSDVAVLIDLGPNVAADHRGILALVGQARDPNHFLSMLYGVPLSAAEQGLPTLDVLRLMKERQPDPQWREQCARELSAHLSAEQMSDVERVQHEGRRELLPAWVRQYSSGEQGQWLTDPERFRHLQAMQNNGRIVVLNADLSGEQGLASVGRALNRWNDGHSPALPVNVVYLSNAEEWVARDPSGASWKRMLDNLSSLPLNPEGVMLRTGSFNGFDGVKGPGFFYQTMPMQLYGQKRGALAAHAANEEARRQAADSL
jgi:hypothetical protein